MLFSTALAGQQQTADHGSFEQPLQALESAVLRELCSSAGTAGRYSESESRHSASKSAIDCPSTPAAPWLAFTRLKASHTSRLGIGNGFALSTGSSRCQMAAVGRWPKLNNAAPSLRSHYRTFATATGCSVPVLRVGTLALAVGAACSLSLHAAQ